ncbi:hypothetical protein ACFW9N_26740 [Streptomyces sp. NPDC059496]|uniref:hypothetical protein n=1 Tax=Streptomyces sp. NPDC059496 TaxID=3346851 RepID=UPI0036820349
MTAIERLWKDFELPVKDALHHADGHSYDVALDPTAPRGFTVLGPFDLDEVLEGDPSWVSSVDGLAAVDLGEEGLLWCGEGSYGSEGFIARLTVDRALHWAMFFIESNPFDRIRLSGSVATFSSTSGFELALDIDDPRTPTSGSGRSGVGREPEKG